MYQVYHPGTGLFLRARFRQFHLQKAWRSEERCSRRACGHRIFRRTAFGRPGSDLRTAVPDAAVTHPRFNRYDPALYEGISQHHPYWRTMDDRSVCSE